MSIHRRSLLAAATAGLVATAGCLIGPDRRTSDLGTLTLAATTSVDDTGLLAELNTGFEARFDAVVQAVPRGTGAALRLLEDGDADAAIAHAPALEAGVLESGAAVLRCDLMWNRFVLVGPEDDPAGLAGSGSLTEAFGYLGDGATFLSRGDNSGTYQREQELWDEREEDPEGEWYQAVGQGMGETLVQADQRSAYTLCDEGTFGAMYHQLDLVPLVEPPNDDALHVNRYGILATNPAHHETVNHDLAMTYIGYVTDEEGQSTVRSYTPDGHQLFEPVESLPASAGGPVA